ncbi:MAG: glycosyltransferase family 4 protein [Methanocellales archaeon]
MFFDRIYLVSWEALEAVGGIGTVIDDEAPRLSKHGEVILIAPWNRSTCGVIYGLRRRNAWKSLEIPHDLAYACRQIRDISYFFGQRKVRGSWIKTLAVRTARFRQTDWPEYMENNVDQIKTKLFEFTKDRGAFAIHSLHYTGDTWYEPDITFGYVAGEIIHNSAIFLHEANPEVKLVASFEEFQTFSGGYNLLSKNSPVGVRLRAHATFSGRHLINKLGPYEGYEKIEKWIKENKIIFGYDKQDLIAKEDEIKNRMLSEGFHLGKNGLEANMERADHAVTVSQITAKEAKGLYGIDLDVVPNGIDTELGPAPTPEVRRKNKELLRDYVFKVSDFKPDFIAYFIGRMVIEKGIFEVINASKLLASLLEAAGNNSKVALFLVTGSTEPGMRLHKAECIKVIEKWPYEHSEDLICDFEVALFKRSNQINLTSKQVKVLLFNQFMRPDLCNLALTFPEFVTGCDVGVFPSTYEPFGLTPLEAARGGTPFITSEVTGCWLDAVKTYIREEVSKGVPREKAQLGMYACRVIGQSREKMEEEIASYIYEIITSPEEIRLEMSRNVRALAERFNWDIIVEKYELPSLRKAHARMLERIKGF